MAAPAPTLRFDQLSVDQGLAQESVLAIAQDRQGYMWFGSQSGLSRYDGYRMVVYKNIEGDKTSLVDNWVGELHVDSQGQLWVGTDNGLDRFDAASQTFIHYAPGRKEQARQRQPAYPRHSRRWRARLLDRHLGRLAAFRSRHGRFPHLAPRRGQPAQPGRQ